MQRPEVSEPYATKREIRGATKLFVFINPRSISHNKLINYFCPCFMTLARNIYSSQDRVATTYQRNNSTQA